MSLRVADAALVALSLSHVPWLVGVVFGPLLDIWNLLLCLFGTATISTIGRRVEYVDNHQNDRSKSGICCRVQTSFLRVDGCCCIGVHVPTSFCCCDMQPVVLGEMSERVFMTLPRECFVLYCKTVEHRSRKSRDLLQTGEFTSDDSSISAHGSGRDPSSCARCV